jgi:single-strand DNA-binding protein
MRQLNSILVEGALTGGEFYHAEGGPQWRVLIESRCGDGEYDRFEIRASGKLAEGAHKQWKTGRELRIVGRLRQERWIGADEREKQRVYVQAEHLEFMPEKKQRRKPQKG